MGTARESMRLAVFGHEKWVVTNAAFEPMPHAFTMPGLAVPRPSIAANSAILRNTLVASDDFLAVLCGASTHHASQPEPERQGPIDCLIENI
jgi:hypothetical protein